MASRICIDFLDGCQCQLFVLGAYRYIPVCTKFTLVHTGMFPRYVPKSFVMNRLALAANMVGRTPPIFLDGNATPTIPHKYSKKLPRTGVHVSGLDVQMQLQRMEGEAASSVR